MSTDTPCANARASIFTKSLITAACLLSGASLSFAAVYGYARGADLPSSLAWAAVGIAAGLVTLALPRHMLTLGRDWPRLAMAALLYAACVSWMLAGALGNAAGGRQHAVAAEVRATGGTNRAQADYDRATAALKALGATRPADAVEADIAGLDMTGVDCSTGRYPTKCGKLAKLKAERANAVEAARLSAQIKAASTKLDGTEPPKPANADAAAIAKYLAAVGVTVTAERVADVLTLLATLVVEVGPGLCLALIVVPTTSAGVQPESVSNAAAQSVQPDVQGAGQTVDFIALARSENRSKTLPTITVASEGVERLLQLVAKQGGEVFGGQRTFAKALSISTGAANELIRAAALSGRAIVETTTRGTRIRLAA